MFQSTQMMFAYSEGEDRTSADIITVTTVLFKERVCRSMCVLNSTVSETF